MSSNIPSQGFERFDLDPSLLEGLRAAGFDQPRPIQEKTLTAALDGRDVLGLAQTGTGKTAAFALPLLDRLLTTRGKAPRGLILAPTRELANQIADETRMLARFTRIEVATIFGGVSVRSQLDALRRRPELVVGCPGRVLDLMGQGRLRLDHIESLVLDEADHMFDMGFLPDIRKILSALPAQRQNLLFSATMPKEIRRLADDILVNPRVVELAHSAPAETIDHALYPVAEQRKRDLLERMLSHEDCRSAIVFTRTKHRARRLADQMTRAGHRAVGLQGNMSQGQRDRAMRGFRRRQFDVLVATDIAARGIDVSGVSHVINYDVPTTPEAYTHRIGRTGRAECAGVACTFVTQDDRSWIRATERMIGSPIPRRHLEGFEPTQREPARRSRSQQPAQREPARRNSSQRPAQREPARRNSSQRPARDHDAKARPSRSRRRPRSSGRKRNN